MIVLFTLIASVFTGCGGGSGSSNNNNNNQQPATTTYSVSFNTNGGSSVMARSVQQGGAIATSPETTRAGFVFDGWFTDNNTFLNKVSFPYTPTGNITLYAKWTQLAGTYTVTFEVNGGSYIATLNDTTSIATEPYTTRTGYDFDGWFATSNFSGGRITFPYTVTQNITLYAKWIAEITENTHDVIFFSNSGSENVNVPHGAFLGSDMPSNPAAMEGYYFSGWNTNQSATSANFYSTTPVLSDMTVYAIYKTYTYTATFYSNSEIDIPPVDVQYGDKLYKPADPVRAGYSFTGWYSDSELTTPVVFPVTVKSVPAFFAKWTPSNPATGISLDKSTLALQTGGTETLVATVLPVNATNNNVIWESSNPAVADVVENGIVEAYSPGTATIYAFIDESNILPAGCEVTVTANAAPISLFSVSKYEIDSDTKNKIEDRIQYSFTYDDYDFYYIYLGQILNVPLFDYGPAWKLPGIKTGDPDIIYKFTRSETTEDQIRKVVSSNISTTLGVIDQNSRTIGGSAGLSVAIKSGKLPLLPMPRFETTVHGEAHYDNYKSNSKEWKETTSLTNTQEAVTTKIVTSSHEFTNLFTSSSDPGYYKWSLFAASDVYLYVIKDSEGKIYFEFREYATGDTFATLDYSDTLSFKKSNTTFFEFDESLLKYLPKPTTGPGMIIFNLNGGTGTTPSQLKGPAELPGAPARAGYAFIGWNTAPNGSGDTYLAGETYSPPFNENTILYAMWEIAIVDPIIIFNLNGGSATTPPPQQQVIAGSTIKLPVVGNCLGCYNLTRTDYVFAGWNVNAAGTSLDYKGGDSFTVTTGRTLYARWVKNETDFISIRASEKTITDDGVGNKNEKAVLNQPYDTVSFSEFGITDLEALSQQGYKGISFYIRLEVREINDGYQWIFLYSEDKEIGNVRFDHSGGAYKNWRDVLENYKDKYEPGLKFENAEIDRFKDNQFTIRYAASGDGDDTWENRNLRIKIKFLK